MTSQSRTEGAWGFSRRLAGGPRSRSAMAVLVVAGTAVGLMQAVPVGAVPSPTYQKFDFVGHLPDGTNGAATITEAFGINNAEDPIVVGAFCSQTDPNFVTIQGCSSPGTNPSHGWWAHRSNNGPLTDFKRIDFILENGKRAFETEASGINNPDDKPRQVIGLYDAKKPTPAQITQNLDTGSGYICTLPCNTSDSFTDVRFPGSASTDGTAINDHGVSIGLYAKQAKPPFADFGWMRTAAGKFCTIDVGKMGIAGGVDTNALGLNNKNDVVGSYDDSIAGVVTGFRLTNVKVPPYKNGKPTTCRGCPGSRGI